MSVKRFGTFKRIDSAKPAPLAGSVGQVRTPVQTNGFVSKEIQDLIKKIDMPNGNEQYFIPKYIGTNEYVNNLTHTQSTILGHAISRRVGEEWILLPVKRAYELCHKDSNFKEINKTKWFHNAELVDVNRQGVIAKPYVVERNGQPAYEGTLKKAKIDTNDVRVTLKDAGLLDGKEKIYQRGIYPENGLASVRSDWDTDGGCFYANALRPSYRDSDGLPGFCKPATVRVVA